MTVIGLAALICRPSRMASRSLRLPPTLRPEALLMVREELLPMRFCTTISPPYSSGLKASGPSFHRWMVTASHSKG